jgi:hypothetical protein
MVGEKNRCTRINHKRIREFGEEEHTSSSALKWRLFSWFTLLVKNTQQSSGLFLLHYFSQNHISCNGVLSAVVVPFFKVPSQFNLPSKKSLHTFAAFYVEKQLQMQNS